MSRAFLISLMMLGGCANETGILLNVTMADGYNEPAVRVRMYVGVDDIPLSLEDPEGPALPGYFLDEDPLADLLLEGRDLVSNPYTLLIKPSADLTSQLAIAAAAYDVNDRLVGFATLPELATFDSGHIREWQLEIAAVSGGARQYGDFGCLKWRFDSQPDEWIHVGRVPDEDCDRYSDAPGQLTDCQPLVPSIHPNRAENCTNGFDDNCNQAYDGLTKEDDDNDGFGPCGAGEVDWNDHDGTIYPDAPELCDGKDNNQDNICNNWGYSESPANPNLEDDPNHPDRDGDHYCSVPDANYGGRWGECAQKDYLWDCAAEDFTIHPGAQELCDGIDRDCDGNLAQDVPCVVNSDDGCRQGRAVCAGANLQECSEVDGVLKDSVCGCVGAIDLLGCVTEKTDKTVVCDVFVDRYGRVCQGNRTTRLGLNGVVGRWTIIGGHEQQGYKVALHEGGDLDDEGEQDESGADIYLAVNPLKVAGDAFITVQYDDEDEISPSRVLYGIEVFRLVKEEGCSGQALVCDPWPGL